MCASPCGSRKREDNPGSSGAASGAFASTPGTLSLPSQGRVDRGQRGRVGWAGRDGCARAALRSVAFLAAASHPTPRPPGGTLPCEGRDGRACRSDLFCPKGSPRRAGMRRSKVLRSIVCWLLLSPVIVGALFPFAVMIITALKPATEVHDPTWWPHEVRWANFSEMWTSSGFGPALVELALRLGPDHDPDDRRLDSRRLRAEPLHLRRPRRVPAVPADLADAVADRAGHRPVPARRRPRHDRQPEHPRRALRRVQHRLLDLDAAELFHHHSRAISRRRPGWKAPAAGVRS